MVAQVLNPPIFNMVLPFSTMFGASLFYPQQRINLQPSAKIEKRQLPGIPRSRKGSMKYNHLLDWQQIGLCLVPLLLLCRSKACSQFLTFQRFYSAIKVCFSSFSQLVQDSKIHKIDITLPFAFQLPKFCCNCFFSSLCSCEVMSFVKKKKSFYFSFNGVSRRNRT